VGTLEHDALTVFGPGDRVTSRCALSLVDSLGLGGCALRCGPQLALAGGEIRLLLRRGSRGVEVYPDAPQVLPAAGRGDYALRLLGGAELREKERA
jgi:hypothetical protein